MIFSDEENEKIIKECTESLETDSVNTVLLTKRGYAYYRMRKIDKAIKDFEEVLKINPDNENAKLFLKSTQSEVKQ